MYSDDFLSLSSKSSLKKIISNLLSLLLVLRHMVHEMFIIKNKRCIIAFITFQKNGCIICTFKKGNGEKDR